MIDRLEFEISLKSPIQFWGNMCKANVNRLLGPEVAQMINVVIPFNKHGTKYSVIQR